MSPEVMEQSKVAFEMAKNDYDRAKAEFEKVLTRADGVGVSRPKLRKIIEERAAVLAASGLFSVPVNQMGSQKSPKLAKKSGVGRNRKSAGKDAANGESFGEAQVNG